MTRFAKITAIAIAACAATGFATTSFAQDSENWTANGPIDYSKMNLKGKKVVWSDIGGTAHQTYIKAYFEPFQALTGVEIVTGTVMDYARIKAQVASGQVTEDIITGSPYVIAKNCGTLFEEVPDTKIYRGNIQEKYLTNKCAIPQSAPKFIVMYNKGMYGDTKPTSCADYFDLTKFPGKRAMWSSVIGNGLEIALLADGVAKEQVYPLDVDRALAKLGTIKSDITFYPNQAVASQGMVNGTFGMVIMPNTVAYDTVGAGADYEPLWDCGVEQTSTLGIVKGTPNLEAALALVGYVTTPGTQSARMAITPHSPVTKEYTLPDNPRLVTYIESNRGKFLLMDNNWWTDNFDTVEQRFQQWQVE